MINLLSLSGYLKTCLMKDAKVTWMSVLESAIKESLNNFEKQKDGNYLSDLYLKFDDGMFSIYDDMEDGLLTVHLTEEQGTFSDSFEKRLISSLKHVLQQLNKKGLFEKEYIFKPFAVSLVNDDFIVEEELIFIDDETMVLDETFFSDIDKELNDFLKELLDK